MKVKYEDLDCCEDCVLYLANGDIPEDRPDLADDIKREWPDDNLHLVNGSDEYDEFSRADCDCCGSRLAGARYRFSVLEPEVTKK